MSLLRRFWYSVFSVRHSGFRYRSGMVSQALAEHEASNCVAATGGLRNKVLNTEIGNDPSNSLIPQSGIRRTIINVDSIPSTTKLPRSCCCRPAR